MSYKTRPHSCLRVRSFIGNMKIGILTFHSQLNYGGVLQCWALQTALEKMGHDVVVIDRWLDSDNSWLEKGYDKYSLLQWIKFCIRSTLGLGNISQWLRVRRTKRFLTEHLRLTKYHFNDWKDAPKELGVDMLVVGSDQVWHCGDWGNPRVYLLDGAPNIQAISYAVSFGFAELPKYLSEREAESLAEPFYKNGFKKFKAISCRESEGVSLCRKLAAEAEHVLDPTLLVNKADWECLIRSAAKHCKKRVVCYLLGINYTSILQRLVHFADENDCEVEVFVDQWFFDALPMPTSPAKLRQWVNGLSRKMFGNVRVCDSAGPIEFVRSIASADLVISDSFHALMFSIIFGKNVRILAPKSDQRKKMFARIEEFESNMGGRIVVDDLDTALESFANDDVTAINSSWLESRREKSLKFLQSNI